MSKPPSGGMPEVCLQPDFEAIPASLRAERAWIGWKFEIVKNRRTKVPYSTSGRLAKSDDPMTWRSFERVRQYFSAGGWDGIGLMRSGRHLFLDLDGCLDPFGEWKAWDYPGPSPRAIVEELSPWAWAEFSPSGTGIHLILDASLPPGRRQFDFAAHTGVAFYDSHRFFALTGRTLFASAPQPGAAPAAVVEKLWRSFQPVAEKPHFAPRTDANGPKRTRTDLGPLDLDGLFRYPDFAQLFGGSWEGRYPSQSEAELAFFNMLAVRGFSPEAAEGIYLRSGLKREKWLRPGYARRTLKKAFEARA